MKMQWRLPSEEQVNEAQAIAADLGVTPYWEGEILCVGEDEADLTTTPEAITMRQARLALLGSGLLHTVDAAIAAMPGIEGEAARIEWEYASEIRRDSPLVAALGPALGLQGEQIDALFVAGAAL